MLAKCAKCVTLTDAAVTALRDRCCVQVFFSRRCPLLRGALPLLHKMLYTYGTYSYFCTVVTTWTFLLVPFMSLMFQIQPVKFGKEFGLAATLYLFANSAVMNYFHVAEHMRGSWMATVSNYLLAYTYGKAIGNTLLAKLRVKKKAGFKATEKTAGGGGAVGTSGATAQIQAALMNRLTSLTRWVCGVCGCVGVCVCVLAAARSCSAPAGCGSTGTATLLAVWCQHAGAAGASGTPAASKPRPVAHAYCTPCDRSQAFQPHHGTAAVPAARAQQQHCKEGQGGRVHPRQASHEPVPQPVPQHGRAGPAPGLRARRPDW